jgi:hypothetical protein
MPPRAAEQEGHHMRMSRALDRDPAAEMMILATEVADGMAATAAIATSRLSDHADRFGDSVAELCHGTALYVRSRPLLLLSLLAAVAAVLLAWRWPR